MAMLLTISYLLNGAHLKYGGTLPTQGFWVQLLMDDESSKLPNVASSPQQMMHKGPWRRQHIKKSAKPVCGYDITNISWQGKTCKLQH
jgi:hypothetical protein